MSRNGKHRRWSAADKLRIVLGAMQPGVEVSDFCRREGVNPVLFYKWKKQLLGSASRVFEERGSKPSAQDQRHEAARAAQECNCRDHRRESRPKKRALGLEDHGQLPPELQKRVHQEVELTKHRSGWSVKRTLAALGIAGKLLSMA